MATRIPLVTLQQARTFGTGARGARGLGWYQKYREGRGGRHLQGPQFDQTSREELAEINNTVFQFGSSWHYLDLQVGGKEIHRLELELATAALPLTTLNFQLLSPQYKDTIVHRIEKKVGLCLGDVTGRDGKSGYCHHSLSPTGKLLETEPLVLSHLEGIVSMISPGVDKVDSRFLVCTADVNHLDGKFVAFGRLRQESLDIVKDLEQTHYTTRGLPNVEMKIVGGGALGDDQEKEEAA